MKSSITRIALFLRSGGTKHRVPERIPFRLNSLTAQGVTRIPRCYFQSGAVNSSYRPTWLPLRVKTPWIAALKKSQDGIVSDSKHTTLPKPDLTPRRMSDSYFSGVGPNPIS